MPRTVIHEWDLSRVEYAWKTEWTVLSAKGTKRSACLANVRFFGMRVNVQAASTMKNLETTGMQSLTLSLDDVGAGLGS